MARELSSYPLPPQHHMKLKMAGFVTANDIIELKSSELSKEVGISNEEALEILQLVKPSGKPVDGHAGKSRTALEMLKDESLQQSIITFSEQLDGLLGGGVPLGKITEFCGAPGIGKTQMGIQLSVDVQLPECFGGIEGEALYVDTEGSFLVDRVVDIAKATVTHCSHIAMAEKHTEQMETLKKFNFQKILAGIHYFRCHDHIELLAVIHTLPDFLGKHPKIRLIVVDSIAFPFRHDFEDFSLRTRLLNGLAQMLMRIASQHKLAVVLTNQMTTRVRPEKNGSSELTPALGESWGHASTIRVVLYWEGGNRQALLYKSPTHQEARVPYQITMGGIRDIVEAKKVDVGESSSSSTHNDEIGQPTKRQKLDP